MAEIVTARLLWRPPHPDDAAALHALVSDPGVARMTATWPWPPDPDFTASRCLAFDPAEGLRGHVFAEGALVGWAGVVQSSKGPSLGYMLARPAWGRGYATEIGAALIAATWAGTGWPWIRATVFEDNPASMRVVTKLGFTEVERGAGVSAARGPGTWPVRRYRLTRPAPRR